MKPKALLLPRLVSATFLLLSFWTGSAAGATEKVLYNFSAYPHGARPYANLIADAGGNLYGTTYTGGAHGLGAVFKLAPSAKGPWTQTVLYSFKGGSDGQYPISRLVFDTAGNLYGTTGSGGTSTCNGNKGGCGTVFKLAPNSHSGWTESVIYKFKGGSDGDDPGAGLTLDSAGNLYGTTVLGGTGQSTNCPYGCGTVFRLAPGSHGTWTESILYNFTGSDGINPQGELIFDSAGSLYGTTKYGGSSGSGAVFKLTPSSNSWTQSVLYSFTGRTDGANPLSSLIFDKAGNLYGTAALGGSCAGGCGVVFELISNGNGSYSESVLHTFVGGASDGYLPMAGLVFDQAGNLYGTTDDGGKSNGPVGVVFKLSPSSGGQWTETIVHAFAGSIDGAHPSSGGALVIDKANNLYGTTIEGGTANTNTTLQAGTAFELTPGASGQWTKSTIYSFPSTDGMNPDGKLIQDASGNFYGTTFYGGTYGLGQVFKLAPNSSGGWTRTVIYNFKATTDGYGPNALVFDKAGNLYGTAGSNVGATTGNGEIFELKPNGSGPWTESTIYTFSTNTADGQAPVGLVIDASGNLYGETQLGGTSLFGGTVYKLTNNGTGVWTKSILYNFPGFNGPEGGLVIDAAGNLYGTTYGGGTKGWGVVFELSNSGGSWTEKTLYEFLGGSDGAAPFGGVIFDPAGNLYGTTEEGGSAKLGTVFKLTPSNGSWTESILHSFTGGSDGAGTWPTMPGLSIDVAGNLYGTTPVGGDLTCNCGIVFELSPGSGGQWTETVLHNFTSFPGDGTGGLPLIVDASGILYGTSRLGGTAGDGTIFEVTP